MPLRLLFVAWMLAPACASAPRGVDASADRLPDLSDVFAGYEGCFVLHDLRTGTTRRYRPERCALRQSPCSTFKIFNALVGLETGVVSDRDSVFRWDGEPKMVKDWERDHTLATAIQYSVVWYFQRLAREVGPERMQEWLDRVGYGNRDQSAGIDVFWLGSSLEISADEEVRFLSRLYRGELPFSSRTQETVRQLLVLKQGGMTLSGKTGTKMLGVERNAKGEAVKTGAVVLGWFVGHVAGDGHEYVFATNIEAADGASGQKAKELTLRVLERVGMSRQ